MSCITQQRKEERNRTRRELRCWIVQLLEEQRKESGFKGLQDDLEEMRLTKIRTRQGTDKKGQKLYFDN